MKNVVLSADGERSVYLVPDEAADNVEELASGPFYGWLENDPRAEKYRTEQGYCFDETAFIEYLAQRFPDTPARFVEALGIDFGARCRENTRAARLSTSETEEKIWMHSTG